MHTIRPLSKRDHVLLYIHDWLLVTSSHCQLQQKLDFTLSFIVTLNLLLEHKRASSLTGIFCKVHTDLSETGRITYKWSAMKTDLLLAARIESDEGMFAGVLN